MPVTHTPLLSEGDLALLNPNEGINDIEIHAGTAQRPRSEPGAGHDFSHQRGLLL